MTLMPPDERLEPVIGGKKLHGVTGYRYIVEVEDVVRMEIDLLAPDDWIPPLDDFVAIFKVHEWSQEARNALREALDEADAQS